MGSGTTAILEPWLEELELEEEELLLLEEDEELEDELSMLGISKSTVTKISSSIWQAVQTTERFGFDSR